jgi:pimeloyl-ACP methyl ester carboxylesterase
MTRSPGLEPLSLFFHSHRLKLHYWDYGADGKPPLVLVHGGLDHARSWERTAAPGRLKITIW